MPTPTRPPPPGTSRLASPRVLGAWGGRLRGWLSRLAGPGRFRARGYLALFGSLGLLVFGGLSHDGRRSLDAEIASGKFRVTPAEVVRAVRAYLTNEDDMYRCHAYAQAILGRPYRSYFVRPRAGWDATFARGVQEDPDATALAHPSLPLRPYRDFLVEYPPGFLLVLLPPALVASTPDGYARAFKLEMAACLLLSLLAVQRLAGSLGLDVPTRKALPGIFAAAVLALGVVSTHRYDAFVAACMALGVLAASRGRAVVAGLWIGLAISAKGVPLLLVPLLVVYLDLQWGRRAATRFLLAATALAAAALAAAWCWCGAGVLDAFGYHAQRPVQIESTWGALLSIASLFRPGLITVVHSFSSRNLRGPPVEPVGALAGVVAVAALGFMTVHLVRRLRAVRDERARLATVADGAVALLASYMTLGKIFCPQYLVWIIPLALLAARRPGRNRRRPRALLAILIATQIIYPIAYPAVKALALWASALVLARNLALLAWSATLLRRVATTPAPAGAGVAE